ncbi:MAG: hypothetical protein LBI27_00215 [Clostridiales bacterium]|nr:hypothetical protein [Clostridiales bacterium]
MHWENKGVIFSCNKKYIWSQTHTQIPTVDLIESGVFRIYYSTRDSQNRSLTSYFDVSADNPAQIIYEHNKIILPLGERGTFDDCGVMPSCVINTDMGKYLYYTGWNVRNTIPYQLSLGLAVEENGCFRKFGKGPIMSRNIYEPYLCAAAYVLRKESIWHMWYTSGTGFEVVNNRVEPLYNIKYSHSVDGIHWEYRGQIAIDYNHGKECIARPCVVFEDGLYKMWYTYRGIVDYRTDKTQSYSIGYAESENGIDWIRMDEKIKLSNAEWDSEMQAYPYVVKHNGVKYMFYNGNGFGQTGIGYAVCNE